MEEKFQFEESIKNLPQEQRDRLMRDKEKEHRHQHHLNILNIRDF